MILPRLQLFSVSELNMRTIMIREKVEVSGDTFDVIIIVSRPEAPARSRDMETIKSEIERLLPGWIKPKIQAGET